MNRHHCIEQRKKKSGVEKVLVERRIKLNFRSKKLLLHNLKKKKEEYIMLMNDTRVLQLC